MVFKWRIREIEEAYYPKSNPEIIDVPPVTYIAIYGKGHPDKVFGEYKEAVRVIKHIATENRNSLQPKFGYYGVIPWDGFFQHVYLQPTEAFWWKEDVNTTDELDYSDKTDFCFTAVICYNPDASRTDTKGHIKYAHKRRGVDCSMAHYLRANEGLCAQIIHEGDPNNMSETIKKLDDFIKENGYELDITDKRHHHEIYYTNDIEIPREKWVTIIRRPIKKLEEIKPEEKRDFMFYKKTRTRKQVY